MYLILSLLCLKAFSNSPHALGQKPNTLAWHTSKVLRDLPLLPSPTTSPSSPPEAPVLQPFTTTCSSQILFFLDSGSLHMLLPLPKRVSFQFPFFTQLIPICRQVSRVTSSQKPSQIPSSRAALWPFSSCSSPHRASSLWVQGEADSEPTRPPPPSLRSRSCSRYLGPR